MTNVFDPAGEWRARAERYHQMNDEELVVLARQISTLTEHARQALTQEIAYRKLVVPPLEAPLPPEPEPNDPDDPYAEERALEEICHVWSLRDALRLQFLLDRADIPFFMGREKARAAENVTSDFSKGVSVQVMSIGVPWARQAMQKNYFPGDEPVDALAEAEKDIPVRCPKCRSTEVVIERLASEAAKDKASPKFEWICDACGYEWEDDGVVQE